MRACRVVLVFSVIACRNADRPPPPVATHIDPPKLDVTKALAPEPPGKPTGALDFELVSHDGAYVLRDTGYEVTFPAEPQVSQQDITTPDGKPSPVMTAIAADDREDAYYSISVTPFSSDMGVDPQKGLDGARDRILESVHAKLLSEAPIQLAGHPARRFTATAVAEGKTVHLDARMLWDPDHRSIVILQAGSLAADPTAKALAFFQSLSVRPGRGSPLDGKPPADGATVSANALDFALVRSGESYTLRDDAFQIAFPARPVVTVDRSLPGGAVAVEGAVYTSEREAYEVTFFIVPKDAAYDADKGLQGTRAALLKGAGLTKPQEIADQIAGLPGKRLRAPGKFLGYNAFYEIEMLWDPTHRVLVSAMTVTTGNATTSLGRAFLDSLAIHAKGAAPH